MNPSALIFLALAVAWAVYLVPKALKHHDEAVRSRSVERFSDTMRVLARREPVDRGSRTVLTPGRAPSAPVVQTKPSGPSVPSVPSAPSAPSAGVPAPGPVVLTPAQRRARREAANRAAARRRRVLVAILGANAVVIGLASFSVLSWWWVAAPVAVLVAWLVACRLMVRQERGLSARVARPAAPAPAADESPVEAEQAPATPAAEESDAPGESTEEFSVVTVAPDTESGLWDPVPVTLPTYVSKPAAARRSVRTIDLDDTGVWTSGRTDADSQIAREAADAERAERAARTEGDDQRAFGS
ncbi:hypothetical protein GHK92_09620 [Nocardioides sp. dk4132]|uniref:divisome protein SepX/GlpR n=1 Tax=unclassified Nocardioides TaxID=2615069 RepID=UPI001295DA0D|nr:MULTISPECIES: hypothetical protein [unclassified Nocardioides]MQW76132.1 hypothetical protein [Nocardioides sp. dk4132]QGA08973.1 hypothetical protein GFH29_17370 [Nocardioides sp. dk884]